MLLPHLWNGNCCFHSRDKFTPNVYYRVSLESCLSVHSSQAVLLLVSGISKLTLLGTRVENSLGYVSVSANNVLGKYNRIACSRIFIAILPQPSEHIAPRHFNNILNWSGWHICLVLAYFDVLFSLQISSKDEDFLDLSVDVEQNTSITHCLR